MAFSEQEQAEANRITAEFIERRRPPADVRDQLDIGHRIDSENQSVQIYEIRPHWKDDNEKLETPVAKVTYVRSREIWKLYWIRADGDWHAYDPDAEVDTLEKAFDVIDEDELCCFWG